uniref:Uncharacterized protein n=1 Tax=Magallana gigas TaxID=29159 RepID=K1PP67_MAGGI
MHDSSKIPRRMAQSEERSWDDLSSEVNCEDISSQGNSATMLMVKSEKGNLNTCYMCVEVMWRTPNILKYRKVCYESGIVKFHRGDKIHCLGRGSIESRP